MKYVLLCHHETRMVFKFDDLFSFEKLQIYIVDLLTILYYTCLLMNH